MVDVLYPVKWALERTTGKLATGYPKASPIGAVVVAGLSVLGYSQKGRFDFIGYHRNLDTEQAGYVYDLARQARASGVNSIGKPAEPLTISKKVSDEKLNLKAGEIAKLTSESISLARAQKGRPVDYINLDGEPTVRVSVSYALADGDDYLLFFDAEKGHCATELFGPSNKSLGRYRLDMTGGLAVVRVRKSDLIELTDLTKVDKLTFNARYDTSMTPYLDAVRGIARETREAIETRRDALLRQSKESSEARLAEEVAKHTAEDLALGTSLSRLESEKREKLLEALRDSGKLTTEQMEGVAALLSRTTIRAYRARE